MPSWLEFRLACRGLYRLALLDRSFLGCFDRSVAGALRSFGLFLPLLPVTLWQIWIGLNQPVSSIGLFLAAKAVGYAYGWILFPFVLLLTGQFLDRDSEAPGCIAIYNWLSVLWAVLQMPSSIADLFGVAQDVGGLLNLAIFVASLVIEGFLFVVAMRLVIWQAVALVAIDVVIGQFVIWPLSDWLSGLPAT
ncbi:MAG: hypothetical protein R3D05_09120 [Dongiaceae bacterium]